MAFLFGVGVWVRGGVKWHLVPQGQHHRAVDRHSPPVLPAPHRRPEVRPLHQRAHPVAGLVQQLRHLERLEGDGVLQRDDLRLQLPGGGGGSC